MSSACAFAKGATLAVKSRDPKILRSSRGSLSVRADKCLIVNTKGGGHAFIGLHLAKKLLSQGHSVSILNDGDQVSPCWCNSVHSRKVENP